MKLLKIFLLLFAVSFTCRGQGSDCRCIEIDHPLVEKERGIVSFRVKNNCNRRIWFYTKGFYMTLKEDDHQNIAPSKLFRLTNDEPEFRLFKWKDEKQMVFHTDKIREAYHKLSFSYSNTSNEKPRSLVGYRTYLCEKDIKDEEKK